MSTTWKSSKKANHDNFAGSVLSCWSRQQKLAMIAGFAILAVLLVVSACSKQSQKSALGSVSEPPLNAPITAAATASQTPAFEATATPAPAQTSARKTKRRAASVSYTDADSGVSFVYPRKFALATGEKAKPQLDDEAVPMNFVQPGGTIVATVTLPQTLYPGTDFASGFFSVNVNRGLSEEQCSHFAFVDTRNADGEPIDAEKVKVGSSDMEMTSEFAGSAT